MGSQGLRFLLPSSDENNEDLINCLGKTQPACHHFFEAFCFAISSHHLTCKPLKHTLPPRKVSCWNMDSFSDHPRRLPSDVWLAFRSRNDCDLYVGMNSRFGSLLFNLPLLLKGVLVL
ncbi:hypothetical protein NPIL_640841 [Nephila pilipes]|uniref:Uncharacterized protein n=1 Tax=Nephila pilipes TaxID=299642 RepID=A0A8X6QCA7_NEPPI|nr:hypothetical protein NPIL_640841 [Nephila pilipes]